MEPALEKTLIGTQIIHLNTVTSTNDIAKQHALDDCVEGLVIVADNQTAGRGQNENKWHSVAGKGLYFSIVLRPDCIAEQIKLYSLLAGVAVNSALRSTCGVESLIKWPNDIYCQSKKIAGVLCEAAWRGDFAESVIIGIGINVESQPEGFPSELTVAGSLAGCGCYQLDKKIILTAILKQLDIWYQLTARFGFAAIVTLYNAQKTSESRTFCLGG